ncbi:MAG: ribosome small subunit-dependent GTPase A [Clostridiales Family XIII bacterium]|nr:ribosome small subunit-dependent GTPase A [Clostridiales Family XIII bacterium]
MRGTIVKALSGFYYVRTREREAREERVYQCRARGIFKKEGINPLVGDDVMIDVLDDEDGFVTEILPRRNSFIRPSVANIDLFVATVSARDPKPNAEVLDRFLATAEASSAEAVICVNKTDLGPADFLVDVYGGIYDTLPVSVRTGEGMGALKDRLAGKRSAFAGPSGVGKSSIINVLLGGERLETGDVSRKTGRGKHTTRHVELFETDFGAELFDTPGYTSFEGASIEPAIVGTLFPEIAELSGNCRFDDCMHADEPGCAVREAADKGTIPGSRYGSYLRMLGEATEAIRR